MSWLVPWCGTQEGFKALGVCLFSWDSSMFGQRDEQNWEREDLLGMQLKEVLKNDGLLRIHSGTCHVGSDCHISFQTALLPSLEGLTGHLMSSQVIAASTWKPWSLKGCLGEADLLPLVFGFILRPVAAQWQVILGGCLLWPPLYLCTDISLSASGAAPFL